MRTEKDRLLKRVQQKALIVEIISFRENKKRIK